MVGRVLWKLLLAQTEQKLKITLIKLVLAFGSLPREWLEARLALSQADSNCVFWGSFPSLTFWRHIAHSITLYHRPQLWLHFQHFTHAAETHVSKEAFVALTGPEDWTSAAFMFYPFRPAGYAWNFCQKAVKWRLWPEYTMQTFCHANFREIWLLCRHK